MSLRLLRAACRYFCGLEAHWKWRGGLLEASSKHFGDVLGRLQRVVSGLESDITVMGYFKYTFINV